MDPFQHDDVPTLGHEMMSQKREALRLYRAIEFEIPKLAAFRQAYVPPNKDDLLQFRFQHYQGADHAASRKATLTVDVQHLFTSGLLETKQAMHNFLLIAGTRFHPSNPNVVARHAAVKLAGHKMTGHVLLSCDKMPTDRQNMKWLSDTFDTMIQQANQPNPEIADLSIDVRHTLAREDKQSQYLRTRKPKSSDFPSHWL